LFISIFKKVKEIIQETPMIPKTGKGKEMKMVKDNLEMVTVNKAKEVSNHQTETQILRVQMTFH